MIALMWRVLRDRWQLLVGTLCAITLGVGLVHSSLAIATTIASAQPPAGLPDAERTAYRARLNGTNTINGIASILGVFLTVFVVRSTIDFATSERRREIALLRLAGAKRRQVRAMLLMEGLALGLFGSVLGGVLGILLAALQRALYVQMGVMPAEVAVGWKPVHLLIDLVVGLWVALAGVRSASKRATRIRPLDALHSRGEEAALMTRSRWVIGGLTLLLTVGQLAASIWIGGFLMPLLLGLGTMVTGSVTASQVGPLLVPLAGRLLEPLATSPLAQLAVAKLRHDARRTAQVAAPLVVLVSLVAGLQGMLDTQTRAGALEITASTRADLLVATTGNVSEQIARIPGVAGVDVDHTVPADLALRQGSTLTPLPVSVIAVDPDRFASTHPYRPRTGALSAFGDDSVVLGPGIEDFQLMREVDSASLTIGKKTIDLTVAATTGEGLATTDGAYISRALVPEDVLASSPSTTLVTLAPEADRQQVREAITALGVGRVSTLEERNATRTSTAQDENRAVMAALVGVGSVYALINLLSTLAIATSQRRSEFALDRLSGLMRRQVRTVVLVETLATVAIGIVLGAVVTLATLAGLAVTTWRSFGTPVVAIPWLLLAGMALLVAGLSAVTASIAVHHATNRPPVHDLTTKE